MQQIANEIRALTLECIANLGAGHIGGSLSIVDLLTVLYYNEMNIDPKNSKMVNRDRLVVSKGHAGPAVYATLAHKGFFDKSWLKTLNKFGTNLPSHCDMNKTPGIDMTTGSLGQGISCAVGMALASKIKNDSTKVYAIIGDGETQEGQVWEAFMFAASKKLNNLICFLDYNKMQIDDYTDNLNTLGDICKKMEGFGFYTQRVNGHNFDELINAIDNAKLELSRPSIIIMDTIKGKGISFVESQKVGNHSMPISKEQLEEGLKELSK